MSDPLLAGQRRVGGLAAQRRPVVLLLHRDPDGVGHAERLPVVLLGYDAFVGGGGEGGEGGDKKKKGVS